MIDTSGGGGDGGGRERVLRNKGNILIHRALSFEMWGRDQVSMHSIWLLA